MKREQGFTLIELLIGATLMIVVMSATLTVVERFQSNNARNQALNDSQDNARVAVEKIGRDLRSAGTPATGASSGIARATAKDLVFQAVDPTGASSNLRRSQWVRYCLDDSVANNERVYRQTLAINGTPVTGGPFSAVCPDAATGTSTLVTDKLVNYLGAPGTPMFVYYPVLSASPTQGDRDSISRVTLDVLANSDPVRVPKATRLTTGIYLRDQGQPPTAAFNTPIVSGEGTVFLNASASTDPAGLPLTYLWCDTTASSACSATSTNAIGQGLTLQYDAPSGSRQITLVATNSSGQSNTTTQTVVVP